jgi:hypothetical protein
MAGLRSNVEIASSLPTWQAKPSEDFPGWLILTCPYEDCGDTVLVRKSRWSRKIVRRETEITGRSCPYCMRVAHRPKIR